RALVEATLRSDRISDALVSVAFVGTTAISRINREYLGHSGPTDVISFGMRRETKGGPAVGDIYICVDVARRNAARHGVSLRDELARLVVHGTLHVAGHEHPDDDSRMHSLMWRKQERILAREY
ncbi:MAG: rRNA maturation RNase YbeY, partial [Gemmatimonadaceae bacterium]|nr:rRNA maturation RNase YbeY [Gemmatimonadaceae bacterium]